MDGCFVHNKHGTADTYVGDGAGRRRACVTNAHLMLALVLDLERIRQSQPQLSVYQSGIQITVALD